MLLVFPKGTNPRVVAVWLQWVGSNAFGVGLISHRPLGGLDALRGLAYSLTTAETAHTSKIGRKGHDDGVVLVLFRCTIARLESKSATGSKAI
jgi:hypothetical protein